MYSYMPLSPGVAQAAQSMGLSGQRIAGLSGSALKGGQAALQQGGRFLSGGGAKALAGRYMPAIGAGLELIQSGDPLRAAGVGLGGMAGAAGGAAIGTAILPGIGTGVGALIGGLAGGEGGKKILGGVSDLITGKGGLNPVEQAQMLAMMQGQSGLLGSQIQMNPALMAQQTALMNQAELKFQTAMDPLYQSRRDKEMMRTAQLNQQLGQLEGALNRQRYQAESGLTAQKEAGATTRTMMTAANPYAQSVFQRGSR